MRQPTALNDSLGKDAEHVGVTPKKNNSYNDFRLLSVAQKILKHASVKSARANNVHRTILCHAARSYQAENIKLKLSTNKNKSKASLSGLQTCGNPFSCPVCGPRIRVQRAKEIKKAIAWAKEEKHAPIMLTVTAAHSYGMRLQEFKRRFKTAWRKFAQSTVWRRLRKMLGIKHNIKATEITRTWENGWHYHYHGLLFVPNAVLMQLDDKELENWKSEVSEQWIKCLKNAGLTGIAPYACNIVSHAGVGAEYLTKLGLEDDTANVEYELTSGKQKNKSRGIMRILRDAGNGSKEDIDLYIEFVEAMQGEFFIFWSDGFKKKVGADDISDEEISSQEDKPQFEEFMDLTDYQFSFVRREYAQADLLDIAAKTRDEKEVINFLGYLQKKYVRSGHRDSDIMRLEAQYLSLKQDCFESATDFKAYRNSKARRLSLEKLIARRDGVKKRLFDMIKNPDDVPF